MASVKRVLAILGAVFILGGTGYAVVKNSPYNNRNITFINRNLNKFSREMKKFIDNDFNKFNEIMYNLQNGNYDHVTNSDFYDLERYIDTIMACNFNGYQNDSWDYRNRNASGFVVEFEKYFPSGSEERNLIQRFSGYYEKGVADAYRYLDPDMEKLVADCTADYHKLENEIYQLPVFPKYIVLKIIRPIIDKNDFQYYPYYKKSETLAKIDSELSKCVWTMQKQCVNPEINYNVSRR